mgnify:CR=1 FL=1
MPPVNYYEVSLGFGSLYSRRLRMIVLDTDGEQHFGVPAPFNRWIYVARLRGKGMEIAQSKVFLAKVEVMQVALHI